MSYDMDRLDGINKMNAIRSKVHDGFFFNNSAFGERAVDGFVCAMKFGSECES